MATKSPSNVHESVSLSFGARLVEAMEACDRNQTELAKEMSLRGVSITNRAISTYVKGTRGRPKRAVVAVMAEILGISSEWLYSGEGPRDLVDSPLRLEYWPVPLITLGEDMTIARAIETARKNSSVHHSRKRTSAGSFAVRASDSANAPYILPGGSGTEGDILTIDRNEPYTHGNFVYIEVAAGRRKLRTVRQYKELPGGAVQLVPLNPDHREYHVGAPGEPEIAIVGRVVEISRII
jgi:SOS-response transcriptional repressor LexA